MRPAARPETHEFSTEKSNIYPTSTVGGRAVAMHHAWTLAFVIAGFLKNARFRKLQSKVE
jgi:hypothetical protein